MCPCTSLTTYVGGRVGTAACVKARRQRLRPPSRVCYPVPVNSLFISFEGGEGTGKSTQAALLVQRLRASGATVVAVREPGGTPLGEQVRPWVKSQRLAPQTELLLFAAARAELVATVIAPTLAQGSVVVADRYADSTIAYQGYGRRLPLDLVRAVNQAATGGLAPAVTFLLDLPAEEGLRRARARLQQNATGDDGHTKFEHEEIAFHRRLRSGFLRLAKEEPHRILVMDATRPADAIAAAVWRRVQPLLPTP
ncbi:MAG: dTMP kinase [Dehalococcoidia bacterium]|nr:dTMP kinase [Dehalococcoidia bacterium]